MSPTLTRAAWIVLAGCAVFTSSNFAQVQSSGANPSSASERKGSAAGPSATEAGEPVSRTLLRELTQEPRLAGTVGSLVGAKLVARHLEEYGWTAEIEAREVVLSIPRRIEFAVFEGAAAQGAANQSGERPLTQRSSRFDPDAIPPGDLPLCNAWSASGDVRARVVDVGRGLRADFDRLVAAGVELKGTIALARYGGCYRGIKVDLATQYGCAGVLLFHEKHKDGETWPDGPWKPGFEGERGSISPIGRTPGDPSTPGWPSPKPGETAQRSSAAELDAALPKIPCIPIGSAEAEMILGELTVRETRGADGQTSKMPIGPGPCEVRLAVDAPRDVRTIYNVVGTLAGVSEDCVIAGCHRDAWVRGANDDGSGVVCMLRAAQQLGLKAKGGWKPANSIRIGFWDAEEFGMIGSTEWAEAHADWITQHCFAYVNSDTACQGTHFRGASGTPGMLRVLKTALERVPTPLPRDAGAPKNLWEDWSASLKDKKPEISPAGSGSDFAVFLHHLNRPVVDVSLGGNSGGQYHTAFDDFAMVDRYLDPGFVGHELCGQLIAELLGELAQQGRAAFDAEEAVAALAQLARKAGQEKDAGATTPWLGSARAERIASALEALVVKASANDADGGRAQSGRKSTLYEALAIPAGIPGREWHKNPIWTPGLEDGYGSEYFPILHAAAKRGEKELDLAVDEYVSSIEKAGRAWAGAKERK